MWRFIFYTKTSYPVLENKLEQYALNKCFVDKVVLNYFFHFKNKSKNKLGSKDHDKINGVTIRNYDPSIQSRYFAFVHDLTIDSPRYVRFREKYKSQKIKTLFCEYVFELHKMSKQISREDREYYNVVQYSWLIKVLWGYAVPLNRMCAMSSLFIPLGILLIFYCGYYLDEKFLWFFFFTPFLFTVPFTIYQYVYMIKYIKKHPQERPLNIL